MLSIEIEREDDRRWIGEAPERSGVIIYVAREAEAHMRVAAIPRGIADRIENSDPIPIKTGDLLATS